MQIAASWVIICLRRTPSVHVLVTVDLVDLILLPIGARLGHIGLIVCDSRPRPPSTHERATRKVSWPTRN